MSAYSSVNANKIGGNSLLVQMVIFSLIDSFIDLVHPSLEGLSFRKRYQGLPSSSDSDVIFMEGYRILKLIRNAAIHSRGAISTLNGNLQIQYTFNNTNFTLQCSADAVLWLYSILILYVRMDWVGSSYYREAVYRSYYDRVVSGIHLFSDEFGTSLCQISSGMRLKITVRYLVENPKYTVNAAGEIAFERYKLDPGCEASYGADYLLNRDGRQFLVPDEALGSGGELSAGALENWAFCGSCT
jgi:hypothetical protein